MSGAGRSEADFYEQPGLWGPSHIENEAHLRLRYAAIDQLLPVDARTALEVGSGDGRVLDHLIGQRPNMNALAVDRSLEALSHQRHPSALASVDAVPFQDRCADAVLCCEVLEHLPHGTYQAALDELGRLANRWVVLTVPNRENRRRAAVRCPGCGCEYNPMRHLRSFTPSGLEGLVPGFTLVRTIEAGPRVVIYPRSIRRLLEGLDVLHRSGEPVCPQCGAPLQRSPRADRTAGTRLRTGPGVVRRLAPKSRRRYWLCALYERA